MKSFDTIRKRAAERKGGEAVLRTLLPTAADNKALAKLSDDRVLSTMANRIFSAGFVWSVIEAKWPGFEEAFLGFEPRKLLFQPDDFWGELASDKRIVRNGSKIKAVRDNAAFVVDIAKEHGSFGKFLAGWPAGDQVGLLDLLSKRGSRLGGATGQYLLRWLGWDAFIVSGDFAAALQDAGLEIAETPTSKRDLTAIQKQLNAWHAETGLPYVHLSRILSMSIGVNRSAEELQRYMGEE
ncbi:MAG: DNA-3-methyladenine glycosylase I [Rhizobiaceae bacterium]|nr:DNA-3-methyladenine glycosylase I [Rhizobiaceae bacterium]